MDVGRYCQWTLDLYYRKMCGVCHICSRKKLHPASEHICALEGSACIKSRGMMRWSCVTVWLAAHEGDYWRLLIPGRYTATACADGPYDCVSKSVVVENHPHTVAQIVDFTLPLTGLDQQASFYIDFQIIFCCCCQTSL